MANPQVQTLIFIAGVANTICLAQAPVAAGALALNGGGIAGGVFTADAARRIALASTGNEGATVFTITGTDRYSNVITESLVIPNGQIALTQQDFLTVTAVSMNAAAIGNVTVGTSNATTIGSGPWIPFNIQISPAQLDVFVTVASAAPSTWTVEFTPDDPNVMMPPGGTAQVTGAGRPQATVPYPGSGSIEIASFIPPQAWAASAALTAKAASVYSAMGQVTPFAYRLTINSGATAVTLQGIQAGICN